MIEIDSLRSRSFLIEWTKEGLRLRRRRGKKRDINVIWSVQSAIRDNLLVFCCEFDRYGCDIGCIAVFS